MNIEFTLHDAPNSDAGGMGVTLGLGEVYRQLGNDVGLLCFADLPDWMPFRVKALVFPTLVARRLRHARVEVIDSAIGDSWILGLGRGRQSAPRPLLVCRSHGMAYLADKVHREEVERGNLQLSWKYNLYWGGARLKQETSALRSADLCLLLNEQERTIAIEELGVDAEKVRVIDNGLPEALIGVPLAPTAAPLESLKIAHIGSYLEHKGISYLVEALESVFARFPQAQVTMLGTAKSPAEVLADFKPQFRDRVTVIPSYRRESLAERLAGHAIVISASLREGFPLGTLEAMACGLVPVVSDIPGPTQYVHDGENGLAVAAADGAALAGAVVRLVEDPELFARLRENAHATAQEYSWTRIAGQTLDLYREAIERTPGTALPLGAGPGEGG